MKKQILAFLLGGIFVLTSISAVPSSKIDYNCKNQVNINFLNAGEIYYVGGSGGNNYSMIQYAIDNASNGDTVFIYDEESPYYENVTVNKSVNLVGENKHTTILKSTTYMKTAIHVSASYVNITGFTIKSNGTGIEIHSSTHCKISNNILSNNRYWGIYLANSSENVISNNRLNNSGRSVELLESSDNILDGNVLTHNEDGIRIWFSSHRNMVKNNNISNTNDNAISIGDESKFNNISYNSLSFNHGYGIYIYSNSHENIIWKNTISDNKLGLGFDRAKQLTIKSNIFTNNSIFIEHGLNTEGNTVIDNKVNGKPLLYMDKESDKVIDYETGQIILCNCRKITIENQIVSNTDMAIKILKTRDCLIENNLIKNNKKAISLDITTDIIIKNNNITNNSIGISTFDDSLYFNYRFAKRNKILRNNFIDNKNDVGSCTYSFTLLSWPPMTVWRGNYWNGTTEPKPILYLFTLYFTKTNSRAVYWQRHDWFPAEKPYKI